MLELKNITKIYNPGTINEMCLFDDFSLTLNDGEFLSIVGSNGSGKTSMLNIICGSIPTDGGTIEIGGQKNARLSACAANRKSLSESCNGYMPVHDNS